jgi:hypothetical protein
MEFPVNVTFPEILFDPPSIFQQDYCVSLAIIRLIASRSTTNWENIGIAKRFADNVEGCLSSLAIGNGHSE